MLDWFSETMLKIVTSVPALFVVEEFPCFAAVRVMFGFGPDRARRLRHCDAAVSAPLLPIIWGRCPICSRGNGEIMPACWRGRR
jgi:hypothetical protein